MIQNILQSVTSKKAETLMEVVFSLFIVGIGITTTSLILNRAINTAAQSAVRIQAEGLATEGIEAMSSLFKTNALKYANSDCFFTIETADVCDPLSSPMIVDNQNTVNNYATFFDYADFTWQLEGPITLANQFTDGAILLRQPNVYTVHEKYIDPEETMPIFSAESADSTPTTFYRRIKAESVMNDYGIYGVLVTSTVKWPYRNKVYRVVMSKVFFNTTQ